MGGLIWRLHLSIDLGEPGKPHRLGFAGGIEAAVEGLGHSVLEGDQRFPTRLGVLDDFPNPFPSVPIVD